MSRKPNKTGRNTGPEPFVKLDRYLKRSKAFMRLSPVARCVLVELVDIYNGTNNGFIAAPARAIGNKLNVSHSTAARGLRDLLTYGFIELAAASDFSKKRRAAEYRLTHLKCDRTGARGSKAFMSLGGPAHSVTSGHHSVMGETMGPK